MQNLPAILEAILFASAKPEPIAKLATALKIKDSEIRKALQDLKKDYQKRGLALVEKDDIVQLVTNPGFAAALEQFWQKELRQNLSQISLETLAIIAYRGPISRYEIEDIRGVNSVFVLRSLLRRDLIERQNKGKRVFYTISPRFLGHLGLTKIPELPQYQEFSKQKPSLNQKPTNT